MVTVVLVVAVVVVVVAVVVVVSNSSSKLIFCYIHILVNAMIVLQCLVLTCGY